MKTKLCIIILLLVIMFFIYSKQYNFNFIEGMTSNEAIQNLASLYNSSSLTASNLTIPSGGNITVASDSSNTQGIVNLGIINSSRTDGTIDITGSGKLNLKTNNGVNVSNDVSLNKTLNVVGDTNLNGLTTSNNFTLNGTIGPITVRSVTGTVSGDDKSVALTCNANEILTGCTCYSPWGECDGVQYTNNGKSCSVYAGSAKQVTGSGICMKIGKNGSV